MTLTLLAQRTRSLFTTAHAQSLCNRAQVRNFDADRVSAVDEDATKEVTAMQRDNVMPAFIIVSRNEIAERAHAMYVARGGQHGFDRDDWLRAERELKAPCISHGSRSGTQGTSS